VRYYLDSSVLLRLLSGGAQDGQLRDWLAAHGPDLVTSVLTRWEVVQPLAMAPHQPRVQVTDLLAAVPDVPISGRALEVGSYAVAAVPPYAALHVGVAAAEDSIGSVVTYDPQVASAARLYGVAVTSPGLPDNWYVQ
jgi:predicted nucleic acid-binding protein